ncbi:MAG: hypothetical protein ACM3PW_02140 [Chlamydiota bacterium]
MISEQERFSTENPNLCPGLRWKRQFYESEPDPTVQRSNDGNYWCVYTQTCVGPDGRIAEPGACSLRLRKCHSTGQCG